MTLTDRWTLICVVIAFIAGILLFLIHMLALDHTLYNVRIEGHIPSVTTGASVPVRLHIVSSGRALHVDHVEVSASDNLDVGQRNVIGTSIVQFHVKGDWIGKGWVRVNVFGTGQHGEFDVVEQKIPVMVVH